MERRYERYGPLWLKLDVCMDRYGFHRSRRNGMNGYRKMHPLRVLFGNPVTVELQVLLPMSVACVRASGALSVSLLLETGDPEGPFSYG